LHRDVRIGDTGRDVGASTLALAEVAHRQHHRGVLRREFASGLEPEPGVRSGDDGDAAGEVGDVVGGPLRVAHGLAPIASE
jgi:hypothetical protein